MQDESHKNFEGDRCRTISEAGQRLKRRIFIFSSVIMLFICAVAAFLVADQRRSALENASAHSANLSAAFEEQVRRVMDGVSGAMELLKQRIEKEGPAFDLSKWAPLMPEAASTIQVSIIGPNGRLVATTLSRTPEPVDLSDREHFRVHRDNPNAGLFVGKAVLGRVSRQLTVQVSKRLQTPSGAFGGVLVFSLNPDSLTSLHRQVDLGQTGNVTLVGTDSIIRARFTSTDRSEISGVGASLGSSRAMQDSKSAAAGFYTAASLVDGTVRLFNWRKVSGYPLVVIVGLGEAEALSAANRHAMMILAIGGSAILLIAMIAAVLAREISRRVANEIALYHEGEKVRAAHASLTVQHDALLSKSAQLSEERINLQQTNAQLTLAQERSELASRAKSAFLGNMSHELRTPLNAIIGFAEIMRDKLFGELSDKYAEYAEGIHSSGNQLLSIIDQILSVAKIEAGKLEISETRASLSDLLETALLSIKPQAENRQIDVSVRLPGRSLSIAGDEARLRQIIVNLLSNAVKFTLPGGRVTVSAEIEEDGGLCITVADTGIGMSQKEIEWALEHFRQVDNSFAKRFEGTGLGLPLARQLAELHGGSLSIKSVVGQWTKVRVRLPAERVAINPPHHQHMREAA